MSQAVLDPVLGRGNQSLQVGGAQLELATPPTGSGGWGGWGHCGGGASRGQTLVAQMEQGPKVTQFEWECLWKSLAWPSADTPPFHS